ncbi:MAG: hypothetical protein HOF84_01670, partial [Rhodospirillales bacterium]|nr:hypothetical protein [Rhodospirillales bacterium]
FHYPVVDAAEHLFEYTLMPTRMTTRFSIRELLDATLHSSFSFTKGVPLLKLPPKTDDGGVPVEGILRNLSASTIAILREDDQVGQVCVHLPRLGYRATRVS